jgi:hypothetical protein
VKGGLYGDAKKSKRERVIDAVNFFQVPDGPKPRPYVKLMGGVKKAAQKKKRVFRVMDKIPDPKAMNFNSETEGIDYDPLV